MGISWVSDINHGFSFVFLVGSVATVQEMLVVEHKIFERVWEFQGFRAN